MTFFSQPKTSRGGFLKNDALSSGLSQIYGDHNRFWLGGEANFFF